MFTRGWNAYRPPYLMLDGNDDNAGGGNGNQEQQPAFPANTPVKDMTPEQQAAYWQHQSRKHEDRVKAFGEYTPDKIRALADENQTLRTQGQSETDKALEAAREEGRSEVRGTLNRERATTALEKALQGRVPNAAALLGLDVSKFIVNGNVDDAAVKAWVDDNSDEAAAGGPKKNPDNGQGRRGSGDAGAAKSVAAGRDLYAERHNKKSTTTS